ncbi:MULTISPECIES: response regulator [Pseudoalteromonas]|uniref:response regulator n=1 Tax=Pseudoalteromonas TaxID=53246 RepID=UPI0006BACEC0|nr:MULTISPECIES: response regulator [Pseudoalteromonas]
MTAKKVLNILYIVFCAFLLMSVFIVVLFLQHNLKQTKNLVALEKLTAMSTELKTSSDSLTRFARMYVITMDEKWRMLFDHVVDIRTGFASPVENPTIYWERLSLAPKSTIPHRTAQKSWPSLLEIIQSNDARRNEVAAFKSALDSSNVLIDIEQQAFDLIKIGGQENVANARLLLFGEVYIKEKSKVMFSINSVLAEIEARRSLDLKKAAEHLQLIKALGILCFGGIVALLLFSYTLLKGRYFSPIKRIHDAVFTSIKLHNHQIVLPNDVKGELGELIGAFELTLKKLNFKISASKHIKAFNHAIRGIHKPKDIIEESLQFISLNFNSPSCAIFKVNGNNLILDEYIGHIPIFDESSAQAKALLKNQNVQTMTALENNSIKIIVNGQQILIQEAHLMPLIVSEQCIGALYIASTSTYHKAQIETLEEVCNDLAIAIKLGVNIEKQNAVEVALSQQLELNHHIINAIPNPTYYRDKQGCFMGVNKAFLNFIDKFEADVIGTTVDFIFEQQAAAVFNEQANEIIKDRANVEYSMVTMNGNDQPVELVIYEAPFFDNKGVVSGIVGMFLDVTKRNELERDLVEAKETADRSAKVKGEFLANMSHEIRTPMNAIIGMAHLAMGAQLNEKQANYVNKIDIAAKQLLRLINDILDYSKIEAGKIEIEQTAFGLDKLLETVSTVTSIKAQEKNLELVFDIPPSLPNSFIGDPLRLSQVLINLVGNAVKFTDSGSVTIKIVAESIDDKNTELKFSVKDTGIGMDRQQQKRLFSSFSQADSSITRKYGGTGLGLTISQQLVKLMGGEIYLESTLGEGSEFYFNVNLPIKDECELNGTLPKSFANYQVLIVDDNSQALDVLEGILVNAGLQITRRDNATAAIELLRHANDDFDLLIMDWQMPEMDGLNAIELLKNEDLLANTKVMLTTAYGRELELNEDQKRLLDAIILKPINPSYLIDSLVACFGTYTSEQPLKEQTYAHDALLNIKLLLAEDQPVNQEIAYEILTSFGAHVDIANNGEEAIKKIEKEKYDLVLMDMQMPVLDGISATKIIREGLSNTALPILAMTANAMQQDINRCTNAGMNGHIAKPIDVNMLVEQILLHVAKPPIQKMREPTYIEPDLTSIAKTKVVEKYLDGVNLDEGIERAAGNELAYFSILSKFLSQQVEELINLKQAITIENYELASNLLHAIKGAAANLAVYVIADKMKNLEQSLKANLIDAHDIDSLIEYVKKINPQCLAIIESISSSKQKINEVDNQGGLIQKLSQALKDFDTEASEIVQCLSVSDTLELQQIKKLQEMVSRFEYVKADMYLTQCLA